MAFGLSLEEARGTHAAIQGGIITPVPFNSPHSGDERDTFTYADRLKLEKRMKRL